MLKKALFGLFATLLALAPLPSAAEGGWLHNGSVMDVSVNGSSVRIIYQQPRSGIAATGVGRGTLLFMGQRSGLEVWGTAYLFRRGCPDAPYTVSGWFDSSFSNLTLDGAAPVRAQNSCRVVDYRWTANSHLEFTTWWGE